MQCSHLWHIHRWTSHVFWTWRGLCFIPLFFLSAFYVHMPHTPSTPSYLFFFFFFFFYHYFLNVYSMAVDGSDRHQTVFAALTSERIYMAQNASPFIVVCIARDPGRWQYTFLFSFTFVFSNLMRFLDEMGMRGSLTERGRRRPESVFFPQCMSSSTKMPCAFFLAVATYMSMLHLDPT